MRNCWMACRAPLLIAVAFLLAGCESWMNGSAAYRYVKNAEGCTVTVNSGRELPEGFEAEVGDNCEFKAKVGAVQQGRAVDVAGVISATAQAVRGEDSGQ